MVDGQARNIRSSQVTSGLARADKYDSSRVPEIADDHEEPELDFVLQDLFSGFPEDPDKSTAPELDRSISQEAKDYEENQESIRRDLEAPKELANLFRPRVCAWPGLA